MAQFGGGGKAILGTKCGTEGGDHPHAVFFQFPRLLHILGGGGQGGDQRNFLMLLTREGRWGPHQTSLPICGVERRGDYQSTHIE